MDIKYDKNYYGKQIAARHNKYGKDETLFWINTKILELWRDFPEESEWLNELRLEYIKKLRKCATVENATEKGDTEGDIVQEQK